MRVNGDVASPQVAAMAVEGALARDSESFAKALHGWEEKPFYKSGKPKPKPVSWEEQRPEVVPVLIAIRDRQKARFKECYETVTEPQREFLMDVVQATGRRAVDIALAMVRFEIYSPQVDPLLFAAAVDIDEAACEVALCN